MEYLYILGITKKFGAVGAVVVWLIMRQRRLPTPSLSSYSTLTPLSTSDSPIGLHCASGSGSVEVRCLASRVTYWVVSYGLHISFSV